jgi:phosphate transport system permease protein
MSKLITSKIYTRDNADIVLDGLVRRRNKDKRLKLYGRLAVATAVGFLLFLLVSIGSKGIPGFFQYYITLEINLDKDRLDPQNNLSVESLYSGDSDKLVNEALYVILDPQGRKQKKAVKKLISKGAGEKIRKMVFRNPDLLGTTAKIKFPVDDDVDSFLRGYIDRTVPEADRRLNDLQLSYIDIFSKKDLISYRLSEYFFFGSASRDAELAGIKGAVIGSLMTLFICFLISFPLGVAAAIYLEEIAKKNKITEFIEININNLAAVPSVVFGILGLAVFIGLFGLPRSVPLVGGMVLALMTLPTIIISSRVSIGAVPPSVRDAALGIGASKIQTIFHHVVPLAMPGMLTGTIIGMARALGETAPLLMIGMVAFIVDIPGSVKDPGTVLPVQIFMWADFAERMFIQKTSAATIVLLVFLFFMNAVAIIMRKRLERRW